MNGYIRKRGKNSWQIIFDLPRELDGRRKQARRTVHGTKREAESKLRELITGVEKVSTLPRIRNQSVHT